MYTSGRNDTWHLDMLIEQTPTVYTTTWHTLWATSITEPSYYTGAIPLQTKKSRAETSQHQHLLGTTHWSTYSLSSTCMTATVQVGTYNHLYASTWCLVNHTAAVKIWWIDYITINGSTEQRMINRKRQKDSNYPQNAGQYSCQPTNTKLLHFNQTTNA